MTSYSLLIPLSINISNNPNLPTHALISFLVFSLSLSLSLSLPNKDSHLSLSLSLSQTHKWKKIKLHLLTFPMTSTVTPQPLPESCRNPTSTSSPPLLFASLRTLASWYYSIFPAHLSFLETYITYFNYLTQNNSVKIHINYNRSNIARVMFPIYWIRNNSNTCSDALEHWTEPLYCWFCCFYN